MVLYCILAVLIRLPKVFVGPSNTASGQLYDQGCQRMNQLMLSDLLSSELEELAKIIQVESLWCELGACSSIVHPALFVPFLFFLSSSSKFNYNPWFLKETIPWILQHSEIQNFTSLIEYRHYHVEYIARQTTQWKKDTSLSLFRSVVRVCDALYRVRDACQVHWLRSRARPDRCAWAWRCFIDHLKSPDECSV